MDMEIVDHSTESPEQGTSPPVAPEGAQPEIDAATKNLIERWTREVKADKKFFEPKFKKMRQWQKLARQGAEDDWIKADKYTVPVITRHINLAVAGLYAKNPRVKASVRKRLMTTVWDGNAATLMAATQTLQQSQAMAQQALQAGLPPAQDPGAMQAQAIVQDAQQAQEHKALMQRIGQTLEILWTYFTKEQSPNFKKLMKQLVRRTKVNGVGFVKLNYQRMMEPVPEVVARIEDVTSQLRHLEALAEAAQKGDFSEDSDKMAELRTMLADLEKTSEVIVREGPVADFPASTTIIPHRRCRNLQGFIGADYVTHEMMMTPEEVKETYKVDIGNNYAGYREQNDKRRWYLEQPDNDSGLVCVWEVQNKKTGQCFTVADGYCGWLKPPAAPDIMLENFWTIFALTFNDTEDEHDIYPPSDVEMLRHPQAEYNRAREGLREHRIANRPKYVSVAGKLEDEDIKNLASMAPHEVIQVQALTDGQGVESLFQPLKFAGIDPNLYEVEPAFIDMQRSVGTQEANLGGTGNGTATESSIAENSRMTGISSNVDDLDEFLTELARAYGQILLLYCSPETVKEIAGPGAVWPELSREQVVKEIGLEIEAGSSGRPNKAAELATIERVLPYLLQIPGIDPYVLARRLLQIMEFDFDDLIQENLPSINALNAVATKQAAMMGHNGGPPLDDPAAQGPQGENNAPKPPASEPAPQPAMPAQGPTPGLLPGQQDFT